MHITFYIFTTLFVQLQSSKVEVKIKQGTIIGAKEMTVFEQKWYFAFYRVPYAKPPVGLLRFQNPKSIEKYLKPLDASTEYHGACAQAHIVHKHALYGNEDCLYLNIYTPILPSGKDKILKAVVIWIHGYAFSSSFSHIHGPDFLIEHDVLFISLTHRIGPFGFLKINNSDSNINMGLKDIITGLKWIRKNIKSFGGDKNKITLMGSGSGGSFALLLLLTKYRKLFHKLIIQSGTMFSPSIFQGANVLEKFKLQHELEKEGHKNIMKAPTQAIVSAINKIYTTNDMVNSQRPLVPFSPIMESESNSSLLTKLKFKAFDHNENGDFDMPILIGFSTQESISELIPFIHNPTHLNSLGANFKYIVPFLSGCSYDYSTQVYNSISSKIQERYFKNHPKISIEELLTYTSDIHKYPIYKFIQTYLKQNNRKMFVYKFNYTGKFNVVKLTSMAGTKMTVKGAAQGDEICYILKCEPLWENYVKIKSDLKCRDRKFIKQLATLWSNFAKFGNPTPPKYFANISWPPMTSKEDNVLLFGKRIKLTHSKEEMEMYKFWNNVYDDYYSSKHCNDKHDEL